MSQIPRLYRRFMPQLLHMIALPLFFFAFILVYRPYSMSDFLCGEWVGVHVTIMSCIILACTVLLRLLYYYLPLKLNYTLYMFWCLSEMIFMTFFVAMYLWLVLNKPVPYFDTLTVSFQYIFLTLVIPYSIIALSVRVYDYSKRAHEPDESIRRMRFYDINHNLKLVVTAGTVLYIGAEENYINIFYTDGGKVRSYVLRNSMKSVDELCLAHGLVRCHRSYYINPSHVKVLRKDKEGVIYAELDAADLMDIPVSKRYYEKLSEMLC